VVGVLGIATRNERHLDQRELGLLSAIGTWAGITIENARLAQQSRRLAVLEERDRIGMDLHDGIIQSIYAVGLALDYARMSIQEDTSEALGKIDAYYSIYVKLLDGEGNAVAGWDGQPRNGEAPTLVWVPGETIEDLVTLTVPGDAPAGEYAVEVGMYRAVDLARCLTLDQDGVPVKHVILGTVRVEP